MSTETNTAESNTVETYANAEELLAAIQPATGGREILDPATGEVVGRAPEHQVADLEAAIAAAHAAQQGWDALGHDARRALMNQAADAIEANAEALAHLLSREQGKPLNGPNARFEVGGAVAWMRTAAAFDLDPKCSSMTEPPTRKCTTARSASSVPSARGTGR